MQLKSLPNRLPPRLQWYLRGEKNRKTLHGLHASGPTLSRWVPQGCVAVDVGANRGIYTYWIAKSASRVIAFEPNPDVFEYLRRAVPASVQTHNVALSDAPGTAVLAIPSAGDGEATLRSDVESVRTYAVECRTLDSYDLSGLGFLKVDVEGSETAVLRGAEGHIRKFRPVVFIELEERHRPGAFETVRQLLLEEFGYGSARFLQRGKLLSLKQFDLGRHQRSLVHDHMSPDYVSNFLFLP